MSNEIIKVTYENDRPTVMGRELYEKLKVKTKYVDWFRRMCDYGFTENKDYVAISQKRETAQKNTTVYTDHQITLDMAKQICMIQRTDVGKQYREYFLEIERKWNSPEAVMARALKFANSQIEEITAKNKELETMIKNLTGGIGDKIINFNFKSSEENKEGGGEGQGEGENKNVNLNNKKIIKKISINNSYKNSIKKFNSINVVHQYLNSKKK